MFERLADFGDAFRAALIRFAVPRSAQRISQSPIAAAVALAAFTFFWNFPSYDLVFVRGEVSSNWPAFFEQVRAPFTDHTHHYEDDDHAAKLGFRFVPALICAALGIHQVWAAVIFQSLTAVLLSGLLFILLSRTFSTPGRAFLAALPFCLIAGGHPYNQDLWGFFDTLAIMFMLAAMVTRSGALAVLFLLLAAFTDERAIIASPTLLLLPASRAQRRQLTLLLLTWTLYAAVRLGLGHAFGLRTAPVAPATFISQLPLAAFALFHGCEGFVLPLGVLLAFWWRSRSLLALMILSGSLLLILGTAVAVIDMQRSMAYLLPLLVVVVLALHERCSERSLLGLLALVTIANLFYSDALPLPLQLIRMIFISHTLPPP